MLGITFKLANKMLVAERTKYTFFTLLKDVGGFNGAIMIFPAFLMSFYSAKMYQQAVAGQTPIRRPQRRNKKS